VEATCVSENLAFLPFLLVDDGICRFPSQIPHHNLGSVLRDHGVLILHVLLGLRNDGIFRGNHRILVSWDLITSLVSFLIFIVNRSIYAKLKVFL
jgi:hypothetical protein